MNPEQWQQIRPILESALELTPASRKAFLDGVCTDAFLRQEIDSLLFSHDHAGYTLTPDLPPLLNLEEGEMRLQLRPGERIGVYEILERIAQGGMGTVYRAMRADGQYRQQVALKIVRGDLSAELTAARFRNERQILASLDHPNIAKILDGGTTSAGLPYFVMELIDGLPITEYCDQRNRTVDERLQLFRSVCAAVQYAHQRLVIHRDLKPSNILITLDGVPKLLDFGIAKILDPNLLPENTTLTVGGHWLMTPEYASPEQLRGETITTATDVYALGLVLYQLLTGHKAYRFSSRMPYDVARTIFETEPEKPSIAVNRTEAIGRVDEPPFLTPELVSSLRGDTPERLHRRLSGDLDNVVLKAIRKERDERYNSADQLSEDIHRHLAGLPITARKATGFYRASKFVLRHKLGVAVVAVAVVVVLAGFLVTAYEAHVAQEQRARAEARFNDVRTLANSLMFDVHDSIQDLPGSTPARKLLVERALRYLDSLSRDAVPDASFQRELATAYEKVGTVQGNPFGANLGNTQGAIESYGKSLAIRQSLASAAPHSVDDRLALARVQGLIAAIVANRLGPNGLKEAEAALSASESVLADAPNNPAVLRQIRGDEGMVAVVLQMGVGDYEQALTHWQKKLSIEDLLLQANPNDRNLQGIRALTQLYVATNLARLGSRNQALDYFRPPRLATDSELATMGVEAKRVNAWATAQRGDILLMDGNVEDALASYQRGLRILRSLASADPANSVLDYDLATAYANVGNALALTGKRASGIAMLTQGVEMFEKQIAHDPAYVEPRWGLGRTQMWADEALAHGGNLLTAMENLQGQLPDWERMAQYYPLAHAILGEAHSKIGCLLLKMKRSQEATREYESALQILEPMAAANPGVLEAQYALADTYSGLADTSRTAASNSHLVGQVRFEDWTKARAWYQRSLDVWQKIPGPSVRTPAGFACGNPKMVVRRVAECNAALVALKPI